MMSKRYLYFIVLLLLSCKACHTGQVQCDECHFEEKQKHIESDTSIAYIIAPYKNKIDSQMNIVIGLNVDALTSQQPEGCLGDFFADAVREQAEKYYTEKIDIAFFNSGALRISKLPKRNIRVTTIYELMPFENEIIVIHIDGSTLQRIREYNAKQGGDPISGVHYTIRNGVPLNILVNNEPIDSNKKYVYATNDYLADGGDNMNFMNDLLQEKINLKVRDLLFDYFKTQAQPLIRSTDGRVQVRR